MQTAAEIRVCTPDARTKLRPSGRRESKAPGVEVSRRKRPATPPNVGTASLILRDDSAGMKSRRAITIQPGGTGEPDIEPVIERTEAFAEKVEKLMALLKAPTLAENEKMEKRRELRELLESESAQMAMSESEVGALLATVAEDERAR